MNESNRVCGLASLNGDETVLPELTGFDCVPASPAQPVPVVGLNPVSPPDRKWPSK